MTQLKHMDRSQLESRVVELEFALAAANEIGETIKRFAEKKYPRASDLHDEIEEIIDRHMGHLWHPALSQTRGWDA